jgi:LysM repeat protein
MRGTNMINRWALALIAVLISSVFLGQPAYATEDAAKISLKKTAVSKQNVHNYTIKKGDVISAIIRRIPGITEEDIPDNYRIIKELNPAVKDLNKLFVGQILILPGKGTYPAQEKKEEIAASVVNTPKASSGTRVYTIKKGDSLINIIHRELKIMTDTIKTLQLIKSMNAHIVNVNKIYAGQIIKLPAKTIFVKAPEEATTVEQAMVKPAESQPQTEKIVEVIEKKVMPPEARLAVIRHVITQMNSSVLTAGNYYLPIPKTGQLTIDCSKIPVIEFDDKTIVFLDLGNRLTDNVKKMISDNWKNFRLVKVDKKDDVIAILKKVIASTKAYTMSRRETPLTIGNLPPVDINVDWTIVKTGAKQGISLTQGLRLLPEKNSLLPKAIKNYAQKNGFIITEIDEESGLVGKPEEIYSQLPLPVFPGTSARDFSYALVTHLGFTAQKNADVKVFDIAKDGFNLSIKTDVLIKNTDKKYIIYSRSMPQQFINILKKTGNELIFVADSDSPKTTMENILRSLGIPFASGYFSFSGMDRNQAPYTINFSGTKIKTDKNLYIIDFDIDPGIRGLLQEMWSVNIARYY